MGANFSTESEELPVCDLNAILPTLQTGDVILFDDTGLTCSLIKLFTRCPWSHVAMVIRTPHIANNEPLIWESTQSSFHYNVLYQRTMNGVNISSLRERLNHYVGYACVLRRLHRPPHTRQRLEEQALHTVGLYNGKAYDPDVVDLFISMHGSPLGDSVAHRSDSHFFCSQLVAQTFINMGVLPREEESKPAMEYIPMDFSEESDTSFACGFSLDPPVLIDIKTPCDTSIHLKQFDVTLHPTK